MLSSWGWPFDVLNILPVHRMTRGTVTKPCIKLNRPTKTSSVGHPPLWVTPLRIVRILWISWASWIDENSCSWWYMKIFVLGTPQAGQSISCFKFTLIHDELFQNLYSTHICHVIYKKRIFSTCNVSHFERVGKKRFTFLFLTKKGQRRAPARLALQICRAKKKMAKFEETW